MADALLSTPAVDPAAQNAATETPQPAAEVQTTEVDAKAKATAPVEYTFKAPEGYEFDKGMIEGLTELAKSKGLSQEDAQGWAEFIATQELAHEEAQSESWQQRQNDWKQAIEADKELGGANIAKTKANIDRVFANADPRIANEVREFFGKAGLGMYPPLVKLFNDLGKKMQEDSIDNGGGASVQRDLARTLFPSMPN
jgi:hypothetical protein